MQKKIFEVILDTDTVVGKTVLAHTVIDLPFTSNEQKARFEKQLMEVVASAVEIIKDAIDVSRKNKDDCNCLACKAKREEHKGGACSNEAKPRYRTY